MLGNVEAGLNRLNSTQRARSLYISKMFAATAVGLFDAALNYLWDETVSELRGRVASYDLAYLFDIAVASPERRKHLSTPEDLRRVDDVDLLRAAREIGLINPTGHAQLDHIRYMRNYASAAHPNQVELTGLQLAGWLETCIKQVITLPVDTVTAETGRLLRNIKEARLLAPEVEATTAFFDQLPGDRPDALAAGFFGLYTDPTSSPITKDNVRRLWPALWPHVADDARHEFGTRYARYVANADHAQAQAARELFDLVDAQAYLPEPVRAAELASAIDALFSAHHGLNNFHTEPSAARHLERLVGEQGDVPSSLVPKYTAGLIEVFLTNGHGVAFGADSVYRELIGRFDPHQAGVALRSFSQSTIAARLQHSLPQRQWETLLNLLEPKLTSRSDRELLEAVRRFTGSPHVLHLATDIQRLLAPRRAVRRASSG